MAEKLAELIKSIEEMSVLELADLVKALEAGTPLGVETTTRLVVPVPTPGLRSARILISSPGFNMPGSKTSGVLFAAFK